MKSLRVVFLGTPEFAQKSLQAIHQSHHKVVGVVTTPDKASGRGQKVTQSAVKIYATENNIPLLQPEKLRNEEFLMALKKLEADIFVVVAFRMMPKILYSMPPMGTFNLHASLLPQYRGAAPINFALINGEKTTGVTTFFINEKIDEGEILLQESTSISPEDNAGTLHDKLMNLGAGLVIKTLDGLANGNLFPKPQEHNSELRNAYKIFKEDTLIKWELPLNTIHNHIRGLSPYPSAFTNIILNGENKVLKIFSGNYKEMQHSHTTGTIEILKGEMRFYNKEGYYSPTEVQLQGKKRMDIKSFLNGIKSEESISLAP